MSLTQEYLLERLSYDPETGIFTWNRRKIRSGCARFDRTWNSRYSGSRAGTIHKNGSLCYIRIGINGKNYPAHRLAFLYMTGTFPPEGVDHKDGCGVNNSWKNIRLASSRENSANRKINQNNTSGFKGVSFDKSRKLYRAKITVGGKIKCLGRFGILEDAHAAYVAAANNYFGEFAREA